MSGKQKTYLWWSLLCAVAVINIGVWLWAGWTHADTQGFPLIQLLLSGIYVAVCAFRSFFPRIDLERYCLIDSPLSSIVLGRSLATLAEISLSMQIALCIYYLGQHIDSNEIIAISFAIVPLIILAQASCWHATLTLNHFWHGVEEFLWIIMLTLAAGSCMLGFYVLDGLPQIFMLIGIISSVAAIAIMALVDIPMYFQRSKQHASNGGQYLNLVEGFRDAFGRRKQTHKWRVWKPEVLWISSYFTIGVWLSIGMIFLEF